MASDQWEQMAEDVVNKVLYRNTAVYRTLCVQNDNAEIGCRAALSWQAKRRGWLLLLIGANALHRLAARGGTCSFCVNKVVIAVFVVFHPVPVLRPKASNRYRRAGVGSFTTTILAHTWLYIHYVHHVAPTRAIVHAIRTASLRLRRAARRAHLFAVPASSPLPHRTTLPTGTLTSRQRWSAMGQELHQLILLAVLTLETHQSPQLRRS